LGRNIAEIRRNADPKMHEEEKFLRKTINNVETRRSSAVQSKNKKLADELDKEIFQLFEKYKELQTKLIKSNPQFASLNSPQPLNLQEIQQKVLDDETVLLEYYLGENRSFLFFATNKNLEIFELPSRKVIEDQIRPTLNNLKSRSQIIQGETLKKRNERIQLADQNLNKNLQQANEILLAPLADKIKNKRLAVVASGVLQYFPFSALRNQSENKYLIETNEIIYLPSASTVSLMRQAKKSKKFSTQLAVLADPVFTQNDMRLASVVKPQQNTTEATTTNSSAGNILLRSDFSRLRFSRDEAQAISSLVTVDQSFVRLDFNANLKSIGDSRFQHSGILHFATHGIVNSQYPELSGIVLSLFNEQGVPQEGFLRLYDIYNLQLNADLVVLSACETALGKEVKGEGIVGLTRGFMYAGTPLVAASLWRVDDRATADLMKRFYQKMLMKKIKPSTAFRQAQIELLKEKSSDIPFYWAGFTLQGDWR
jgi:CHAT domain-containing protein